MILRRLPDSRFSIIERAWEGEACVLIAGGPSLTQAQVDMVRDARVRSIAINDAYRLAPWADVNYFADAEWFRWHKDKPEFKAFAGVKCSMQSAHAYIDDESVHLVRNKHFPVHGYGLSADPECLVTGRHSGFQALNMAILAGAKRVLLLGYDGQASKEGKRHFFGDHPRIEPDSVYEMFRRSFSQAEKSIEKSGVEVINCSPGSAIDTFRKADLEETLRL
jgi:hypothetical protein